MSKVLDICSETLRRQFHVALLCLLWFFTAFFHALLCLLVIAFLNYPMEEWFNSVTSYPYNGGILSEFNQTSGRLRAAFTPNQVLQWKAAGLCSLWCWQHNKALCDAELPSWLCWTWTVVAVQTGQVCKTMEGDGKLIHATAPDLVMNLTLPCSLHI